MNKGAQVSTTAVLLFLHADTELPEDYNLLIRSSLRQKNAIAGAFLLKIASSRQGIKFIQGMANLRSRLLQKPYGDQGLFLQRKVFHDVGAFPTMPFMEDYEMSRRLSRRGRIVIAKAPVTTSARRWEALGIVKTTLLNQFIVVCYHLGVPVSRLQQWYRSAYRLALRSR